MNGRRQGSRGLRIQTFHNGVADQNGIRTGGDSRSKRNQIPLFQLPKGTLIDGDSGVGVGIVAVTGKMLPAAADPVGVRFENGVPELFLGDLR